MNDAVKIAKKKAKNNPSLKKRLIAFNDGVRRCQCCDVQLQWKGEFDNSATTEHLVPAIYGGSYESSNIIILCRKCNNARGSHDFIEWCEENDWKDKDKLITKYKKSKDFPGMEAKMKLHQIKLAKKKEVAEVLAENVNPMLTSDEVPDIKWYHKLLIKLGL